MKRLFGRKRTTDDSRSGRSGSEEDRLLRLSSIHDTGSRASSDFSNGDSPPSVLRVDRRQHPLADDMSSIQDTSVGAAAAGYHPQQNSSSNLYNSHGNNSSSARPPLRASPKIGSITRKTGGSFELDKLLKIADQDEQSMVEHSTAMNKRLLQNLAQREKPGWLTKSNTADSDVKNASFDTPRPETPTNTVSSPKSVLRYPDPKSPKHFSSALSVSICTSHSANTSSTTLPSGNTTNRDTNALNSIMFLSLIMPELKRTGASTDALIQEVTSSPRDVILRSVQRNLNYMTYFNSFMGEESRKVSVPVHVDDTSFVAEHNADTIITLDRMAQRHLRAGDYQAVFDLYLTLYNDMKRQYQNIALDTMKMKKTVLRSLCNRLSMASFLAGSKNRCFHFAKEALRLTGKNVRQNLVAYMQMGLLQFGTEQYDKAAVSWREASYKAGYNLENAALLWNNIAALRYYANDLVGSEEALLESLALQKQTRKIPSAYQRHLLNMSVTLCNLAVLTARRDSCTVSLAYLEEGLLLQESVLEDDNEESDMTKKEVDIIEQHVRERGRNQFESTKVFNPEDQFCLWSDTDGLALLRGSSISSKFDYIEMGSLVHELGPYQRIRDVMMKGFVFDTQGDDEVLSISSSIRMPRTSLPVDVDGRALLGAEHRLSDIYEQATQHLKRRELDEVLELLKGTLRSHRNRYGTFHPLVGSTLHNLGITMMYAEKYSAALAFFQHAAEIRSATLGEEHPETSTTYTKIGLLQASLNAHQYALSTFSEVLRSRRKSQGYNHVEAAKALNNLACVHYECDGLTSAMKALEEAVDILEKNAFSCGSKKDATIDVGLVASLCNMAFIDYKRGNAESALELYKKARDVLVGMDDVDHLSFATTVENIQFLRNELDRGGSPVRRVVDHDSDEVLLETCKVVRPYMDMVYCG